MDNVRMPAAIGETLRQARLAKGIELAQVEERTKLRVRYLRALEAEDWEALPGDAYARGFLRTYGDYLGLDGLALVEEYRRLVPPPEAEQPVEPLLERGRRPMGSGLGLSPGGVAGLAVAGVIVVLLILGLTGGSGDDEGKPKGPDRQAATPTDTTTTTTSTVEAPPSVPETVTVRLAPSAPVWVCLVDQGGKRLVEGVTLNAGQDEGPFEAREMEMTLGNAEIEVRLNGEPIAIPDSAEPLGYRLTPQGAHPLAAEDRPTCS
jgi:transcriptional regulator with XRE-family HTH domain